jgi:hypothetical protein
VCLLSSYITTQSNTYSSNVVLLDWLVIQVASDLYPPCSVANIFGNRLHDINHGFRNLIRVECFPLFGHFGYIEMTRCLMINAYLLTFIYWCTGILRSWSYLQRMENHDLFMKVLHTETAHGRDAKQIAA